MTNKTTKAMAKNSPITWIEGMILMISRWGWWAIIMIRVWGARRTFMKNRTTSSKALSRLVTTFQLAGSMGTKTTIPSATSKIHTKTILPATSTHLNSLKTNKKPRFTPKRTTPHHSTNPHQTTAKSITIQLYNSKNTKSKAVEASVARTTSISQALMKASRVWKSTNRKTTTFLVPITTIGNSLHYMKEIRRL